MEYEIKKEGKFDYVEVGEGEPLMLLHGLFGALSNFSDLIEHFKHTHKVIVPILPLYDLDLLHTTVKGLAKHVQQFIDHKGYNQIHLLGNSLGGHVGLVHILNHPEKIKTLILTGSSGLFENAMGDSYPKRGDYEYIRAKTAETFYDPAVATKELVDEVFEITNSIPKVMRIIAIAKSAQRNNMAKDIVRIDKPTLLIWGLNDTITPPHVGHEFNSLIKHSELQFIDHCCHAPMMERPVEFNEIVTEWLNQNPV